MTDSSDSDAGATDGIDVIVVGAGFAGMYAVHRFRELGLAVKVLEAGSDVGGTWYWNRYPGARCDVPSLEYSYGFSTELENEWDWPEVFSSQVDILAYANHTADKFDLRRDIVFNTRVTQVAWQDVDNKWELHTEKGETFSARFCVMATGCLSVPNVPLIPGADTFAGDVLHTGRWPKAPVDLSGKRVGVIGTGSSGVQAIPELAEMAASLTVFQRTPVYTVPANRKKMRAEVQDEYRANYKRIREMQQGDAGGVSNYRAGRNGANTAMPAEHLGGIANSPVRKGIKDLTPAERRQAVRERGLNVLLSYRDVYTDDDANAIANELYCEFVGEMVDDPDVVQRLLPREYGIGCKRQVIDRDYYATYNRADVTLVDLRDTPIESITPTGVTTSAGHHEIDILIYATGFDAMTGALLRANITGRHGYALADKWADGPVAYLGLQMRGFPNLFTVTGPGSPSVLCNMLVAIEQHINWIGDCITQLDRQDLRTIEPLASSEQEWVAHVNAVAEGTMYTSPGCNSWYLGANIPGKTRIFMPYVGGYPRYKSRCDQENEGGYPGFALQG